MPKTQGMAFLPIYKYFIKHNQILPVSEFVSIKNEGGIYEVIRVINGVPLFLEEHLARLFYSAEIAKKQIPFNESEIESMLKKLIDVNERKLGNIFISCNEYFYAFYVESKYPDLLSYQKGIDCGTLIAERNNPNAKILQTSVRGQADKLIANRNLYEVLLVDNLGRITEGSRSNVFFIRENEIITPPGNEVLLGITRKKAISLSKNLGFKISEKDVLLDNLSQFQAVFITGTSPKFLPLKKIDEIEFDPQNKIVQLLIKNYDDLIAEYIRIHQDF